MAGILFLGGLSFLALLYNASQHLDRLLVQTLQQQLHRPVRVGRVGVLQPGVIRVSGLAVANGNSFAAGTLLEAPSVIVRYRLWDLLRGRVNPVGSIASVAIDRPFLLIVRDPRNHFNLQDLFPKRRRPPRPTPFRGVVRVTNGTVRLVDHAVRDLPGPQTNVLGGLDAVVDAGAPPLIVFTATGHGDGSRVGTVRGEGNFVPETAAFNIRVSGDSGALPYWSRYFAALKSLRVTGGRGTFAALAWKRVQGTPVAATIRVDVQDGSATTPYIRTPLQAVRGELTIRTGHPLETVVNLAGTTSGIPVQVFGSLFTGTSSRMALRASARNVTLPALRGMLRTVPNLRYMEPLAPAVVDAQLYGPPSDPVGVANVTLSRAKLYNTVVSDVAARVQYRGGTAYIPSITGRAAGEVVTAEGSVNLRTNAINLVASVPNIPVRALGLIRLPLTGTIHTRVAVSGTTANPRTGVLVTVTNGRFRNLPFERMAARISVGNGVVLVENAAAIVPGGTLLARGTVSLSGPIHMQVNAAGVRLDRLLSAAGYGNIAGTAFFAGRVDGTLNAPRVQGITRIFNANVRGQRIDYAAGDVTATTRGVQLRNVRVARYPAQGVLSGAATFRPNGQIGLDLQARLQTGRLESFLQDLGMSPVAEGRVVTPNTIRIGGTASAPTVSGRVLVTNASVEGYPISTASADIRYAQGTLRLSGLKALSNAETPGETTVISLPSLIISGNRIETPQPFTATNISLDRFPALGEPYVKLTGTVNITGGTVTGTTRAPVAAATVQIPQLTANGVVFDKVGASITYQDNRIVASNVSLERQGATILSVARAAWNTATESFTADLRVASLNLGIMEEMARRSPWLDDPEARSLRTALEQIRQMQVHLDGATLSLGGVRDNGATSGLLHVAGTRGRVTLDGAVVLRNLRVANQTLGMVSLTGIVENLRREAGRWRGTIHVPKQGLLAESQQMIVTGQMDASVGGDIEAQMDATNVPISFARLFVPATYNRYVPLGNLTLNADVAGTWDAPRVTASVSGDDITFGPNGIPLSIRTSAIQVHEGTEGAVIALGGIRISTHDHYVRITGQLPWDWSTFRIPRTRPLSLEAHVNEQGLDILNVLFRGEGGPLQTATGSVAADVYLTGTLNDPQWKGGVQVADGTVQARSLETKFQNITADLQFAPAQDALVVNTLTMASSNGGRLVVQPGSLIRFPTLAGGLASIDPHLSVVLNDFRIQERPNALGYGERVRTTLSTPPNQPIVIRRGQRGPLLQGQIVLSNTDILPPSTSPPAQGGGQPPVLVPSFDLTLVAGKNVWVRNALFRVHMDDRGATADRSLHVTGTVQQPRIDGRLTSHDGVFSYPTARFRLTEGVIQVHYPPVGNLTGASTPSPDLLALTEEATGFTLRADAEARLYTSINGQSRPITVYMHIEGPNPAFAAAPEEGVFGSLAPYRISLRSSPSLPERQLVALITREAALQQLAQGGNVQQILQQETLNVLQASVLPEALSGFESRLGQAFGLEYLNLEYQTSNNQFNITATKRITDRLMLTYSRPFGAEAPANAYTISLEYEISPRLRLTLQQQRNPFITGLTPTTLPGMQATTPDTQILLEGTLPF